MVAACEPVPAQADYKQGVTRREEYQVGYHVTILRTEAGVHQPITEDEVRSAIVSMAGRLDILPGAKEWCLGQPALGLESEALWMDDGALWATNPSEPFLALMIELAGLLGARVRGDEGETYRSLDDVYIHPDDKAEWDLHRATRSAATRKTWWRRAVFAIVIVAAAVQVYRHFK